MTHWWRTVSGYRTGEAVSFRRTMGSETAVLARLYSPKPLFSCPIVLIVLHTQCPRRTNSLFSCFPIELGFANFVSQTLLHSAGTPFHDFYTPRLAYLHILNAFFHFLPYLLHPPSKLARYLSRCAFTHGFATAPLHPSSDQITAVSERKPISHQHPTCDSSSLKPSISPALLAFSSTRNQHRLGKYRVAFSSMFARVKLTLPQLQDLKPTTLLQHPSPALSSFNTRYHHVCTRILRFPRPRHRHFVSN
jgi:hypothetical protein